MKRLEDYDVGNGGLGTTLIDSCVEPKGDYELVSYGKYYTFSNAPQVLKGETPRELNDNNVRLRTIERSGDGRYGNWDCYQTENDQDNTYDVAKKDPPEAVKEYYSVTAGEGGGGAVVITW